MLCMVIYILTAISLAGMAPLQDFNADTAMADAFSFVGLEWASIVIYLCAFFGITAACFTNMIVSKAEHKHIVVVVVTIASSVQIEDFNLLFYFYSLK